MSYITSSLIAGESVVYRTRLHWIVMFGHLILGGLLIALSGALFFYVYTSLVGGDTVTEVLQGIAAALLLWGTVTIAIGLIRRSATEVAVTTRRVVIKQGLISRNTIEMLLGKVETIEVREPTLGRLLGYGSIVVIGTGGTSEVFHRIARPLELRSQVQQQLERSQPAAAARLADAATDATRRP